MRYMTLAGGGSAWLVYHSIDHGHYILSVGCWRAWPAGRWDGSMPACMHTRSTHTTPPPPPGTSRAAWACTYGAGLSYGSVVSQVVVSDDDSVSSVVEIDVCVRVVAIDQARRHTARKRTAGWITIACTHVVGYIARVGRCLPFFCVSWIRSRPSRPSSTAGSASCHRARAR